jgi:hypothetical protein
MLRGDNFSGHRADNLPCGRGFLQDFFALQGLFVLQSFFFVSGITTKRHP